MTASIGSYCVVGKDRARCICMADTFGWESLVSANEQKAQMTIDYHRGALQGQETEEVVNCGALV